MGRRHRLNDVCNCNAVLTGLDRGWTTNPGLRWLALRSPLRPGLFLGWSPFQGSGNRLPSCGTADFTRLDAFRTLRSHSGSPEGTTLPKQPGPRISLASMRPALVVPIPGVPKGRYSPKSPGWSRPAKRGPAQSWVRDPNYLQSCKDGIAIVRKADASISGAPQSIPKVVLVKLQPVSLQEHSELVSETQPTVMTFLFSDVVTDLLSPGMAH